MAVPLLATWRMKFLYTVNVLSHTQVVYTDAQAAGASYNVYDRTSGFTLDVQDAADGWANSISAVNPTTGGNTGASWTLQELVGITWFDRISGVTTLGKVASTTYFPAGQMTMTLRDISGHFMRNILLEMYPIPPYRFVGSGGLSTPFSTAYAPWTAADSDARRPWLWALTRGGNALANDPLIAMTGDLNDQVRRARGVL